MSTRPPKILLSLESGWADLGRMVMFRDRREVRLSPMEAKLLAYLSSRSNEIIGRGRLLVDVWQYHERVRSRTVYSTMNRLRRKIEIDPSAPRHLITAPGQGYMFVPLEHEPRPSPIDVDHAQLPIMLGRYKLIEVIGTDVDARRFRAEIDGPAGLRKTVSILVRRVPERARQLAHVLERRLTYAASLKHNNVVDLYEFGRLDADLFTAMEWSDAPSLRSLIAAQGPLPPPALVEAARVIIEVLCYVDAHHPAGHPVDLFEHALDAGWIRGTPRRLLVECDVLGIARSAGGRAPDHAPVLDGARKSPTIEILDPITRMHHHLSAFGRLVVEMGTGQCVAPRTSEPGEASTNVAGMEHVEGVEQIVSGLGSVVERCLSPDPDRRFPTLIALADALGKIRTIDEHPSLGDWLERIDSSDANPSPSPEPTSSEPQQRVPRDLDPFVGRIAQLTALDELWDDGTRLFTLLGPGGAGKSRLARHYAHTRTERHALSSAWFCALSETRDLAGILRTVGDVLGVRLSSGALTEQVATLGAEMARHGAAMIILDNFERITELAPDTVCRWQQLAPDMRFIVTSRERLRVTGEHTVEVASLDLDDGIGLFEQRAGANLQYWEPVEAQRAAIHGIVRQVDALPLAIELAAARTGMLSPIAILDRLGEPLRFLRAGARDRPLRHQALRSTIDWSWALLQPWERTALLQLSVFRGGFGMHAAERVLDLSDHSDAPWALDVVASLLDKSLIRCQRTGAKPRFGMYVSIHSYVTEKFRSQPAEQQIALKQRHAAHFSGVVHRLSLRAPANRPLWRLVTWQPEHSIDLENHLMAIDFGLENDQLSVVAGSSLVAFSVYSNRGPLLAGMELFERLLTHDLPDWLRLKFLGHLAFMLQGLGRIQAATSVLERAVALARDTGAMTSQIWLSRLLAQLYSRVHKMDEAHELISETAELARKNNALKEEVTTQVSLANLLLSRGDLEQASQLLRSAISLVRTLAVPVWLPVPLNSLGLVLTEQGKHQAAREHFEEALSLTQEHSLLRLEGVVRGNLGSLLLRLRDHEGAERHLLEAIDISSTALPVAAATFASYLALSYAHSGRLDQARALLVSNAPLLKKNFAVEYGKNRCISGLVACIAQRPEEARSLLAEAERLASEAGVLSTSSLGYYLSALEQELARQS